MWEYKLRQAPNKIGSIKNYFIYSESASYKENQVFFTLIGPGKDIIRESFRTELFSPFIQQNEMIILLQPFHYHFTFFFFQIHFAHHSRIFWHRNDVPFDLIIIRDPFGEILYSWFYVGFISFSD